MALSGLVLRKILGRMKLTDLGAMAIDTGRQLFALNESAWK